MKSGLFDVRVTTYTSRSGKKAHYPPVKVRMNCRSEREGIFGTAKNYYQDQCC
jgi:hypothetical protein